MRCLDGCVAGNRKTTGKTQELEVNVGNRNTLCHESASLGHVDRYELLRELDGGWFGVVYLACGKVPGAQAKIKRLFL